jgi:hypothetical protein
MLKVIHTYYLFYYFIRSFKNNLLSNFKNKMNNNQVSSLTIQSKLRSKADLYDYLS